jgi:dolichol-phosphate mannosyltransferase
MKKISIIIPVYDEQDNIYPLFNALKKIKEKNYLYEIIFVEDGSTDQTLKTISKLSKENNEVKYISLSRNFGHQIALKAGLDHATGDCVITMDGDLQHPPKYIPAMIKKWQQGYDVVYTVRQDGRETPLGKRITSWLFYKLVNLFSDVYIPPGGADFRLIDKKVIDVLKNMNETPFFLRGIVPWSGFSQISINFSVEARSTGKTKYSIRKMLLLALDGLTAVSIKPLRMATFLGFFFAFISGVYGIYAIVVHLMYREGLPGWASIVTSVVFMGGVQLMILGIIGEYLGKLFIESKRRPLYIVKKSNINDKQT